MTGLRLSHVKRRSISSAKVYQKTDSHSITVPLFFNKISAYKSIKKDVPDYQAHLRQFVTGFFISSNTFPVSAFIATYTAN